MPPLPIFRSEHAWRDAVQSDALLACSPDGARWIVDSSPGGDATRSRSVEGLAPFLRGIRREVVAFCWSIAGVAGGSSPAFSEESNHVGIPLR